MSGIMCSHCGHRTSGQSAKAFSSAYVPRHVVLWPGGFVSLLNTLQSRNALLRGFIFWNFIFLLAGILAGALLKERMITWWNKLKELHDEMQRKRRDMQRRALAELHARDYVRQTTQILEMYRGHVSADQVQPPQLEPLRVQAAYDRFLMARSERRVRERNVQEQDQQGVDEDGDVHMRTEEENNTMYDWSPTQGRMVHYRILENSSDASSGENYFQRTRDGNSYVRRYRPTSSEREDGMTDSDPEERLQPARRSSPELQEEPVDPTPNRFEDWGYLYTLIPQIEKIRVERIYEAVFLWSVLVHLCSHRVCHTPLVEGIDRCSQMARLSKKRKEQD